MKYIYRKADEHLTCVFTEMFKNTYSGFSRLQGPVHGPKRGWELLTIEILRSLCELQIKTEWKAVQRAWLQPMDSWLPCWNEVLPNKCVVNTARSALKNTFSPPHSPSLPFVKCSKWVHFTEPEGPAAKSLNVRRPVSKSWSEARTRKAGRTQPASFQGLIIEKEREREKIPEWQRINLC